MNVRQKEQISRLRSMGKSYSVIATELGISENTIKSYCHRNNLGANFMQSMSDMDICANCGKPLNHTLGAKRKRFCSDKCRMSWWNSHPEVVDRKAVYRFNCVACGVSFESYGNKNRKYCSRACFGASGRVTNG